MRQNLKTVLAVSTLIFTMQFSLNAVADSDRDESSEVESCKALTPKQCVALRKDLAHYTKLITRFFGNGPVVKNLIKLAQADTDKLCPPAVVPPPPGNGYTPDTINECAVPIVDNSTVVSLGLNASGAIDRSRTPAKILCISASACTNIVSQKFYVYGPSVTARCQDPNDMTVQHLTDAQLQVKITAVP